MNHHKLNHHAPIIITSTKDNQGSKVVNFGPLTIAMNHGRKLVPATLPFVFTSQHVEILMDIIAGERVLLTGHTGCGKTTSLEQIAARIGMGLIVLNMSDGTDASTLIGSYVARKVDKKDITSSTVFIDGPLVQAMKEGHWVIIDEMDFAQPGIMTILNGLTSESKTFINHEIAGTETIQIHPDFRLMGTANTVGPMSDFRYLYSGTPPMNPAQLERYRVHVIDYLPKSSEIHAVLEGAKSKLAQISINESHVSKETVAPFVEVGRMIREMFIQGEISTPVSTRGLIHWVAITVRNLAIYPIEGDPASLIGVIINAAGPAMLNKMSSADALRVIEVIMATNNFKTLLAQTK